MSIGLCRMARRWRALWCAAIALYAMPVAAQVAAPSIYTTAIQVQGEPAGAEYADWAASGIPIVDMDPADNAEGDPPAIDIANVQVANDANFIYIHATMHNATTSLARLYLAFDTDQDTATGFNIFGLGLVGSEFGYQTDFPFAQDSGTFNTGASITGGPLGNGGALIFPFWTEAGPPVGNEFEWAVPRDAFITQPASPAFPNQSFNFLIWTDTGLGDVTQAISYTLAATPTTPGDFDDDSDVDGQDFLLWQRGLGGEFTANDLADWRANFGAASAAAIGAVPEPVALAMASIGAIIFLGGRITRLARSA